MIINCPLCSRNKMIRRSVQQSASLYQTAQHMTLRRVVFVFVYFELIHSQLYGPKMTEKLLFFPIFILIISRLPIIQFWKIRALWAPLGELYTLEMVKTRRIWFFTNLTFWEKTPKFKISWRIDSRVKNFKNEILWILTCFIV